MALEKKKRRGLTVGQKLVLIIGLPLLLQLAISFGISWLLDQAGRLANYEYRSKEVISRMNWLGYMAVTSVNAWVGSKVGPKDPYETIYAEARRNLANELPSVTSLLAAKEEQAHNIERLQRIIRGVEESLDHNDDSPGVSPGKRIENLFQSETLRKFWSDFPAVRTALLAGERSPFKASHLDVEQTRNEVKTAILIGAGANIMMALVVAALFALNMVVRVRILTENTRRLAENKELQRPLGGSDEIAELDDTFHSMAKALREARHKERAIFENTADVICVLSSAGVFKEASPASRLAWGYEPGEVLGRSWEDFISADDRQRAKSFVAHAMSSHAPAVVDLIFQHRDGRRLDFRWSGSWSEEHQSLFCVAHDVSEQKKMEKMKREFVQLVSHDLRSPLTAIQGFLVMIQDGVYGQVPAQVSGKARKSSMDAERLIGLINNLLDIEKLEAGGMELLRTETTTATLIERAVASIDALAEMMNVNLAHSESDLPVYCDDMQIVQVLVNLMSNAIKFSPPGGKVSIEAAQVGETVEFRVVDEGRGIPPEFRESIFDRFKQVYSEDGRVKKGTGLGLAICKAIVEAHQGQIGFDSEVGKGTTFWFRIAARRTDDANSDPGKSGAGVKA
ncbi:MAG TPA: PAS domain-containing sensor histidine kinase [Candidatus Obscuribacterales bacterium]